MSDLPSPEQVAHDEAQVAASQEEIVLLRALEIICRRYDPIFWKRTFEMAVDDARRQLR